MTVYETTNPVAIRQWAGSRKLWPGCVAGHPDRIRLGGDTQFSAANDKIEPITWEKWFAEFENRRLMLIFDPSQGWFTLAGR